MSGHEIYIVGEKWLSLVPTETPETASRGDGGQRGQAAKTQLVKVESIPVQARPREERAFRYGRMFQPSRSRESFSISKDDPLSLLGIAMHQDTSKENVNDKLRRMLPAGYTYLGQFITHDITFDKTQEIGDGELDAEAIQRGRRPFLKLDSLYGMGPLSQTSRHLYENDRLHFKIGQTTPTRFGDALKVFPNDLPRGGADSKKPRTALIADSRNDRNLALAQTHLAFLKFHNAVVDKLASDGSGLMGKALFDAARKEVIRCYQAVVLFDYLRRICNPTVYSEMLAGGQRFHVLTQGEERSLPIEFAFAAYRFGHSLVRDEYEWNHVFQTGSTATVKPSETGAKLHLLFSLSGLSGNLQGALTLPSSWVINWRRFYDFKKYKFSGKETEYNRARKIGASISLGMKNVPGFPAHVPIESRSIAVLDLQIGRILNLPSGQAAAKCMEAKFGVKPLDPAQIADGPNPKINQLLRTHDLHRKTPLWFYLLREAEIEHDGLRLGKLGSRIVAETIVSTIEASGFSILDSSRKESVLGIKYEELEMADILYFVGGLNPLEE